MSDEPIDDEFLTPPKGAETPARPAPKPLVRGLGDGDRAWYPRCTPERRAARIGAPPKFKKEWTFDSYDYDSASVLRWLDRLRSGGPRGLMMCGTVGNGKSVLGVCALRQLAAEGVGDRMQWNLSCEFDPFDKWATLALDEGERRSTTPWPTPVWYQHWPEIMAAVTPFDPNPVKWFEKLRDVTCLMLDELGVKGSTDHREEFLRRHLEWLIEDESRTMIITTNVMPQDWAAKFNDPCADRLVEDFEAVVMLGDSLRRSPVDPDADDMLGG